jgi:hypothetical protein
MIITIAQLRTLNDLSRKMKRDNVITFKRRRQADGRNLVCKVGVMELVINPEGYIQSAIIDDMTGVFKEKIDEITEEYRGWVGKHD